MSLATITARLTEKSVKPDRVKKRRVLRSLKIVYEGGSVDGKSANFPTRDISCIVIGLHRGNWHFFETYKRTIWVNLRNRRAIFRWAGSTVQSNNGNWWSTLLVNLHIRKLKTIAT